MRHEAETIKGDRDGFGVAVRFAGQGADGFIGGDEDLASKGTADEIEERLGQVRQVSQGAVLDLAIGAVRLPQQIAGVGVATVLALDLGYMRCGR